MVPVLGRARLLPLAALGALCVALLATASAHAQSADLVLTMFQSDSPAIAGDDIAYTILIDNGGPNAALNVQLTDMVPLNTTF